MGNDKNEFARIIIPRQYLNKKKKITLINLVVQGEGGNKEDGTERVRTTLVWDTASTNLVLALLLTLLAYAELVMREGDQLHGAGVQPALGATWVHASPPKIPTASGGAVQGPPITPKGNVFRGIGNRSSPGRTILRDSCWDIREINDGLPTSFKAQGSNLIIHPKLRLNAGS